MSVERHWHTHPSGAAPVTASVLGAKQSTAAAHSPHGSAVALAMGGATFAVAFHWLHRQATNASAAANSAALAGQERLQDYGACGI